MKRISIFTILLALFCGMLNAEPAKKTIKVKPEDCVIIYRNAVVATYAAQELQLHLKLITGKEIPITKNPSANGKFAFYVGIRPADDSKKLSTEEARCVVSSKGVWFYGSDKPDKKGGSPKEKCLDSDSQVGTLFAVYEFLEKELGVRWIEPGDEGIAYNEQKELNLTPGKFGWVPQLVKRHMRTAYKEALRKRALSMLPPKTMQFSDDEFKKRQDEEYVWRRRMRLGASEKFTYGHSFTKWWKLYGKEHPEYFALNKSGKRAPIGKQRADRIKMCVSNPALVKQVVKVQLGKRKWLKVINACENDSRGFCRCKKCMALDVRLPGEENVDVEKLPMTDRYVHFTNAVLREAKKVNPKIKTVFYAYSSYNFPPRRERLDNGIITFLLPNLAMTEKEIIEYFKAWKKANAKETYLRPNDMCQDTGLPLGFEQHMFMKFKRCDEILDIEGTDYDTCFGFWPTSGIMNYIMARAFYRPKGTFEQWENEYYQAFGPAAGDIKKYYQYWRQIWNQRIMHNLKKLNEITPIKMLIAKVSYNTDLLYDEKDFDITDGYLKAAGKVPGLNANQKKRIETLILANQHNRLKYRAMAANRPGSKMSAADKLKATRELYDFRVKHRMDLNIHWELLYYLENTYCDVAGNWRLEKNEPKKRVKVRKAIEKQLKGIRSSDKPLR